VEGFELDFKKIAALVVAVLILLLLCFLSYVSVPAGNRGVLLRFGAVEGVLGEGAHLIVPFVQSVVIVNTQTQKFDTSNSSAASQDLQEITTDVVVNYHLDPADVSTLYNTVGTDYAEKVIAPKVQETLKAVVAKFTASQLITERQAVTQDIATQLTSELAQYNIEVDPNGVSLTNFDFSQQFDAAIEAKQVAQQQAEQQEYVLQQARLQAQTAVTTARGQAEASKITAAALNAQGGSKVLAQAWISKWDGHLPTVVSGGSNIIDLSELLGKG
jgi:regulator of protease activity HflC (stomatin/prohibitin superfamily)